MKYRQAVISVFKTLDDNGTFSPTADIDIIYRQPFNNLGLAIEFSFANTYFAPYSTCNITVHNPSSDMVDAFIFDSLTYRKRPKVEIRAGYSEVKMKSNLDVGVLKGDLDLIYWGHPIFSSDDKVVGSRLFTIQLSNIVASTRVIRVQKLYRKGWTILSMLKDLASVANLKTDFSALEVDEFASIKLDNPLYFNNRQIVSQVLPALARDFKFYYFIREGSYIFKSSTTRGIKGTLTDINSKNGMIERPVSINWVHYSVKTLFGLPEILDRGSWVRVQSPVFAKPTDAAQAGIAKLFEPEIDALIVEAKYNWNDEDAFIEYIVSPSGNPLNANPIQVF